MRADGLYICPWSLNDPLCQSQTFAYLRGLARHDLRFALITFENPRYALSPPETERQKAELAAIGIYWYPIKYHQGTALAAKAIDNFNGVRAGLKIWRRHNPRVVHSRSSLTAAMALVIAKMCRLEFLYDADSMLSEEYADIGHWSRRSSGYRLMSKTEHLARRGATEIVVLSETLRDDFLQKYNVKVPITVIPCCVDADKYAFSAIARKARRGELRLENEKLLIYVGKIGGRYLVENAFEFFKIAAAEIENLKLLIVSHEPAERFDEIARKAGVAETEYFVRRAAPSEVVEWLSAADAGLALIKSSESERGASPIKIAEYLSVGLPVIITGGIGDCSRLIREKNVGAVLENLTADAYAQVAKRLSRLFDADKTQVAERCRQAAVETFALEKVGVARYRRIYRKLLKASVAERTPSD